MAQCFADRGTWFQSTQGGFLGCPLPVVCMAHCRGTCARGNKCYAQKEGTLSSGTMT